MGRRKVFSQKNIDAFERKYGDYAIIALLAFFVLICSLTGCIMGILLKHVALIIIGIILSIICIVALILLPTKKPQKATTEDKKSLLDSYENKILNEESRDYLLNSTMQEIDQMDGVKFEQFVCALYNRMGYEAKRTKASGDFGADIVAVKNRLITIIQTKRYSNKVGVSAVQEVVTAKNYYMAYKAAIVTNSSFTQAAVSLAKANQVVLVDRLYLEKLIKQFFPDSKIELEENQEYYLPTPPKGSMLNATFVPYSNYLERGEVSYTTYFEKHMKVYQSLLGEKNFKEAYDYITQELNKPYPKKNIVETHFILLRLINSMYTYRTIDEKTIDYTLSLCQLDIDSFEELSKNIESGISVPSLTRAIIICEKRRDYQKAIDYCDIGIKYNYLDDKLSFEIRKSKLLKKLGKPYEQ